MTLDQEAFIFINQQIQNGFFDWLMPQLRNKYTWIPFYVLIFIWLIWKYKYNGLLIAVFTAITFGFTDFISSSIMKPLFERLRPCNDPFFRDQVRLLINCGPGYSFTSSHATNHFGLAFFLILIFYNKYKWVLPLGILWALSVGFAQIYVGVHYPGDIAGGAVLGALIAFLVWLIYRQITYRFALEINK